MQKNKRYTKLPREVRRLLEAGAWLTGSSVKWVAGGADKEPNDFDVFVPHSLWNRLQMLLSAQNASGNATLLRMTSNGGLVFCLPCGSSLDVWTDDFAVSVARSASPNIWWHPVSGTLIKKMADGAALV